MSNARADAPGSVAHRLPAASVWTATPGSAASRSRRKPRAAAQPGVNAHAVRAVGVARQGAQTP